MKKIKFKDWTCTINQAKYNNNRTALMLVDAEDGMPIATASVNIPEATIADDEIIIKSWSENLGMVESLTEADVIGPAIGNIATGHVVATVHKLLI